MLPLSAAGKGKSALPRSDSFMGPTPFLCQQTAGRQCGTGRSSAPDLPAHRTAACACAGSCIGSPRKISM